MTIKQLLGQSVEDLEKLTDAELDEICKPYLLPTAVKLQQQLATQGDGQLHLVVDCSGGDDDEEEVAEAKPVAKRKRVGRVAGAQAEAMKALAKAMAAMQQQIPK